MKIKPTKAASEAKPDTTGNHHDSNKISVPSTPDDNKPNEKSKETVINKLKDFFKF